MVLTDTHLVRGSRGRGATGRGLAKPDVVPKEARFSCRETDFNTITYETSARIPSDSTR